MSAALIPLMGQPPQIMSPEQQAQLAQTRAATQMTQQQIQASQTGQQLTQQQATAQQLQNQQAQARMTAMQQMFAQYAADNNHAPLAALTGAAPSAPAASPDSPAPDDSGTAPTALTPPAQPNQWAPSTPSPTLAQMAGLRRPPVATAVSPSGNPLFTGAQRSVDIPPRSVDIPPTQPAVQQPSATPSSPNSTTTQAPKLSPGYVPGQGIVTPVNSYDRLTQMFLSNPWLAADGMQMLKTQADLHKIQNENQQSSLDTFVRLTQNIPSIVDPVAKQQEWASVYPQAVRAWVGGGGNASVLRETWDDSQMQHLVNAGMKTADYQNSLRNVALITKDSADIINGYIKSSSELQREFQVRSGAVSNEGQYQDLLNAYKSNANTVDQRYPGQANPYRDLLATLPQHYNRGMQLDSNLAATPPQDRPKLVQEELQTEANLMRSVANRAATMPPAQAQQFYADGLAQNVDPKFQSLFDSTFDPKTTPRSVTTVGETIQRSVSDAIQEQKLALAGMRVDALKDTVASMVALRGAQTAKLTATNAVPPLVSRVMTDALKADSTITTGPQILNWFRNNPVYKGDDDINANRPAIVKALQGMAASDIATAKNVAQTTKLRSGAGPHHYEDNGTPTDPAATPAPTPPVPKPTTSPAAPAPKPTTAPAAATPQSPNTLIQPDPNTVPHRNDTTGQTIVMHNGKWVDQVTGNPI